MPGFAQKTLPGGTNEFSGIATPLEDAGRHELFVDHAGNGLAESQIATRELTDVERKVTETVRCVGDDFKIAGFEHGGLKTTLETERG